MRKMSKESVLGIMLTSCCLHAMNHASESQKNLPESSYIALRFDDKTNAFFQSIQHALGQLEKRVPLACAQMQQLNMIPQVIFYEFKAGTRPVWANQYVFNAVLNHLGELLTKKSLFQVDCIRPEAWTTDNRKKLFVGLPVLDLQNKFPEAIAHLNSLLNVRSAKFQILKIALTKFYKKTKQPFSQQELIDIKRSIDQTYKSHIYPHLCKERMYTCQGESVIDSSVTLMSKL